jgi:hypothetical protein
MTDNVSPVVRSNKSILAMLCLLAGLVVLQRLVGLSDTVERDTAGYAVIGHEMLGGRALYSDLWERKPPLLYATFAAAELVAGYGPREIFLLNVSAALITLLAVFFAVKACGGNTAAIFAGIIWLLIGNDIRCQADQPNAEVFVNACLTSAVALMLNTCRSIPGISTWATQQIENADWRSWMVSMAIGLLLALATLFEQHIAITCGLLLLAQVHRRDPKSSISQSLVAGAMVVVAWVAITIYFAGTGRFHAFFDTLFRQNIAYGGSLPMNVLKGFLPWQLLPVCMPWALVLLFMIVVSQRLSSRGLQLTRSTALLLAWSIGTAITVALPGKAYVHYYQLWLPIWCIAGGCAAGELVRPQPSRPALRFGTVTIAMAGLLAMTVPQYTLTAPDRLNAKYPRERFAQQRQLGLQLKALLTPQQRFYDLGEDTSIYYYAQRSPGSGLLYVSPLTTGANTAEYIGRLIQDLQTNDLLLISLDHEDVIRQNPPLAKFLREHYQPVPGNFGCHYHRVMVRNGSDLLSRLSAPQYVQLPMD